MDCDCWSSDFSQFRVFLLLRRPAETAGKQCSPQEVWDGKYEFYFEVVYCSSCLPDALLPYQQYFEKRTLTIAGEEFAGWRFTDGYDLDERQLLRRQKLIDGEVVAKRTAVVLGKGAVYKPLAHTYPRISIAELAATFQEESWSCLVYMGAGISAGRMMYNADINKAIGRIPDTEVDEQVITVISGEQGRNNVAAVYSKGVFLPFVDDSTPTAAHEALAELVLAKSWPVITTNSDLLLEHAGASAVKVGGMSSSVEDVCSAENLRKFRTLLCIGVGGDHRHVVKRYREHGDGQVVVLVRGDVSDYILPCDRILEGDVQETLPMLTRAVLDAA